MPEAEARRRGQEPVHLAWRLGLEHPTVLALRVQSTQIWRIYLFSIRNRNYGLGVYASYLGTWTHRVRLGNVYGLSVSGPAHLASEALG